MVPDEGGGGIVGRYDGWLWMGSIRIRWVGEWQVTWTCWRVWIGVHQVHGVDIGGVWIGVHSTCVDDLDRCKRWN